MNLRDLLDVKAICDTGSFRKAAEQRGVSQPTLSNRVAHLEGQIGARLFERSRGRSEPTDLARFIASRADRIAVQGEVLLREVTRAARGQDGIVRLGIGAGLGEYVIGPLVMRTAERMPRVALEFHSGSTEQVGEWLRQRTIDLAVCAPIEPPSPRVVAIATAETRMVVVANPQHPMFRRAAPEIGELFQYPFALPFTESRYLDLARQHYGLDLLALPGRVMCSGYEPILRLLRASTSHFSAGPEFAFRGDLRSGQLRALEQELPFGYVFGTYVNRDAYPFPAVREVQAILGDIVAHSSD